MITLSRTKRGRSTHALPSRWALLAAVAAAAPVASAAPLDPASFQSAGSVFLNAGVLSIDTDARTFQLDQGPVITGFTFDQGTITQNNTTDFDRQVTVFDFDALQIGQGVTIRITGSRPLALLSRSNASIAAKIVVSGGDAIGPTSGTPTAGGSSDGPGFPPAIGVASLNQPGRAGGFGGAGGNAGIFTPGGRTYGDLLSRLQGGSGAEHGISVGQIVSGGGAGGGAIEIGAAGALTLSGPILAYGGSSAPAEINGGGGSGGGILLHAGAIQITDALLANGGSGRTTGGGGGGGRIALVETFRSYAIGSGLPASLALAQVAGGAGNAPGSAGVITYAPTNIIIPSGQSLLFGADRIPLPNGGGDPAHGAVELSLAGAHLMIPTGGHAELTWQSLFQEIPGGIVLDVQGGSMDIRQHNAVFAQVQLTSGWLDNGVSLGPVAGLPGTGRMIASQFTLLSGDVNTRFGGSGAVIKDSPGTVNFNNVSGVHEYTGGTNILNGTLALKTNNLMPIQGNLTLNGGTLDTGGFQQPELGKLLLSGGSIVGGGQLQFTSAELQAGSVDTVLATALITKTGDGSVRLLRKPTTPSITIQAGDLVGTPDVLPAMFKTQQGGAAVVDVAELATFTGTVEGTGALGKTGPGRLTIGQAAQLDDTVQLDVRQGIVQFEGASRAFEAIKNAGQVRINAGQYLLAGVQGASNSGKIEINGAPSSAPTELEVLGDLSNGAGTGLIALTGVSNLRVAGKLTNGGGVSASFASGIIQGDIQNQSTGMIALAGGSKYQFDGDVVNDGLISVGPGSAAIFQGAFTGAHGVSGTGSVEVLGDLRPGHSPAAIGFGGDVAFGPLAALQIELAGTTPGTAYDQVQVAGTLTADGAIDVVLINGFAPQAGDRFEILTYGELDGRFTLHLPSLAAGQAWSVDQQAHALSVAVVPEPAGLVVPAAALLTLLRRGRRRN